MHGFLQDIRYGLRMLGKAPGITLAAILAFGILIGANTATFSTANTFLLHPISLPQVDRLAMVLSCAPAQTEGWSEVSPAAFEEWRAQNHSFESLAVYPWDDVNLIGLSQRVHEIGIRMAIGKPTDVLRMFILNGLKLLAFGIVIGLPLAFALARLLSSLLFGPNPTTLPASLETGWFSWRSCSLPATSRRAPPLAWIPSLP